LRENAGLTTRQAGAVVGVSHTTISQFETGKRASEGFRIEQLVKAYGYTMEQFNRITGNKTVLNFKDDCLAMLNLMDDEQLAAIRAVMSQMLRRPLSQSLAELNGEVPREIQ
jgi:transcriptional regulator with XRE-family HTH domain